MEVRLKYGQLAPEGLEKMRALEHYLNTGTTLERSLLEMVRLRVSLMNGCEFCVRLHTAELGKVDVTADRIDGIAAWRGSSLYTERERAALAWAEALTNIQDGHAPDAVYEGVRAHFNDVDTVNLTLVITTINAWNRISIGLGAHSGRGGGGGGLNEDAMQGPLQSGGKGAASGRGDAAFPQNPDPLDPSQSADRLEPFPEMSERAVVLRAEGLTKTYAAVARGGAGKAGSGKVGAELELFRGLDLTVHAGEMVAIVGESGAGKSSLLHLLAALDRPTVGEVWYGEDRLSGMSAREAAEFRNRRVGYVWQFHYLLPEFTAGENVAMPLLARGTGRAAAMEAARVWLERVGLGDREEHRSGELSGGEQQRVSLARALVTEPQVLLADEPTGDLDGRTAEAVFALLQKLHADYGLTSVLVTHNLEFAGRCDRMLRLREGKLI